MAMDPIEAVTWSSKIGSHLTPALDDFHTPPDAVPAYIISGLDKTT